MTLRVTNVILAVLADVRLPPDCDKARPPDVEHSF
jgi:hypothetical protein